MSKYWDNETVYSQPTLQELRDRVKASNANAAKKKLTYDPIKPFSRRNICTSWWGQAWCSNLEQYADYATRLDRGKRYVKAGTVIDLQIKSCQRRRKSGARISTLTGKLRQDNRKMRKAYRKYGKPHQRRVSVRLAGAFYR